MALEEEMALAVLKGDKAAALALADRLCEYRHAGMAQLPAIETLDIDICDAHTRVAVFIDHEAMAHTHIEFDIEQIQRDVARWLEGGPEANDRTIVLFGIKKIEVYKLRS